MHSHECPLCDSKYTCSKYGCEDYDFNVCEECEQGLDEAGVSTAEVGGEG